MYARLKNELTGDEKYHNLVTAQINLPVCMNGWLSPGSRWFDRAFPGRIADNYPGFQDSPSVSSIVSLMKVNMVKT